MIDPSHLKIEIWPPRQTGGQIVGPGPQGVKITHLPSGLEAVSISERSQHRNKAIAMAMIEGGLTSPGYRGIL
jgi:protein subunit release factor A